MNVLIPTYKRWDRQPTLHALAKAGVPVTLAHRVEEAPSALETAAKVRDLYGTAVHCYQLPEYVTNIGQTRQALMEAPIHHKRVIMMDDDLAFACRGKRTDNPLYLSPCDSLDIREMVEWLWNTDDALAGISAREGNNRKEETFEFNTRMMRAWSIDLNTFNTLGARFDQLPCIEDFDVILQFLTKGHRNVVHNHFTTNQAGSNTDGGCSTYRTLEVQAEAAKALAAKYPGFVKAVEKTTKGAWGGGTRTDVTVYWKKAYQHGVQNRNSDEVV